MRICFFNRSYFPDLGATGQLLTELAEDLVQNYGCNVSVVAGPPLMRDGNPRQGTLRPWQREFHNGVEIFRVGGTTFRPSRFAGRATNYLSYFLSACLAALRVPRLDIVVSLTDPPVIGLAALLAARRSGARLVFLCQDVFPEVTRLLEDFHSATVYGLLDRISRFLIRKADCVVALGENMAGRLIRGKDADPSKVTVIHNWADCSAIFPGPKRNPFSVAHGLAEAFVVMHSGNVGLSQGLETLLNAAAELRQYRDIILAVVGDGAKRSALEARARSEGLENVRFLAYQPREKLVESFAAADVFVVSLKKGLAGYIVPSKLYGILAAGRPYVAAVEAESEVADISRKYECGVVVDPENPEALAAGILRLYHDRELACWMGENARRASVEFDRPTHVRAYFELFQRLSSVG